MRGDDNQHVQLRFPREARASGSSVATDPQDGGRDSEGDVIAVCKVVLRGGRPSIAPERLFRSLLLQIFYSVRSKQMLIEQLQYNLLFRWFVGMQMDEAVWNHAVFSKNRERLLKEEIAESFFRRVLERARPYMSDEHFTLDRTPIEA